MDTETTLTLIGAVLLALIIVLFQYYYKEGPSTRRNFFLAGLRFLTLSTIGILLINPSVTNNEFFIEKPRLIFAFDNSKSISINSQNTAILEFKNNVDKRTELLDRYEVSHFSFGESLNDYSNLNFGEKYTNITAVLKTVEALYENEQFQLVLVTDGNQTIGKPAMFQGVDYLVNTVVVGDTTAIRDIEISTVNTNNNAYAGNEFPIEVFVNYNGNRPVRKRLSLYTGTTLSYSEVLSFDRNIPVQTASIYHSSEKVGINNYSVHIENLEGERNIQNNIKYFNINILDESSKTLLLYHTIHPDLGALKNAIEKEGKRQLDIENIESFVGDISDYQLVILYQPNAYFSDILESVQVDRRNCLIITGLSTDWKVLQDNFSYLNKDSYTVQEAYLPKSNNGFQLFSTDIDQFTSYPPLVDKFGKLSISGNYQALLFQKIGAVVLDSPMLFITEENEYKNAFIIGENIYKWRMQDFIEHGSFNKFDGFIDQFIQYLSAESGQDQLQLDFENSYYSNEAIVLRANYTDGNFNFNPNAKLWISVFNASGKVIKKTPFVLERKNFRVELPDIQEGLYSFEVTILNQSESKTGSFQVLPFEIESQFTTPDKEVLMNLSERSGGKLYLVSESDVLIEDLLENTSFTSIQKSRQIETPLIEMKWLLLFLLFLLSLEWLSRKYYGKI